MSLFHNLCKSHKLSTPFSSLTLLLHNESFTPGYMSNYLCSWPFESPPQVKHFIRNRTLQSHARLQTSDIPHITASLPRSIRTLHVCSAHLHNSVRIKPCYQSISVNYDLLFVQDREGTLQFIRKWEASLNMDFTAGQWRCSCLLAHKGFISTRIQELSYSSVSLVQDSVWTP